MNSKPAAEPPLIWVDSNEDSHRFKSTGLAWSAELKRIGFNPETTHLPVGDFKFIAASQVWYVERKKAPSDLEASFTDGRLSAQYFKAQEVLDPEYEHEIILLEGDPNQVVLDPNIKNTLISLQAGGVFIDFCRNNGVVERLYHLEKYLNKAEHSYLRRPVLPQPGEFTYTDRALRNKVQLLMCFRGIGEKPIVECLRRYTLGEILEHPELIKEVTPSVTGSAIRGVYQLLGRDVPEGMGATPKLTRSRGKSKGVAEVNEIIGEPLDVRAAIGLEVLA